MTNEQDDVEFACGSPPAYPVFTAQCHLHVRLICSLCVADTALSYGNWRTDETVDGDICMTRLNAKPEEFVMPWMSIFQDVM